MLIFLIVSLSLLIISLLIWKENQNRKALIYSIRRQIYERKELTNLMFVAMSYDDVQGAENARNKLLEMQSWTPEHYIDEYLKKGK